MSKVRSVQASFVSGELDPRVIGRIDTDLYVKGAAELRNVYVRPQGGAFRREGLEFVDGTTTNQAARLVPFEYNDIQTYVLVFTPGEFKVYRTDLLAVQATISSSPISGLTANQIAEMRWTQSADTLYLTHPDVQPIKITRTSHVSWTATSVAFSNIPPFAFGALSTSTPAGTITPDVTTGLVNVSGAGTNFVAGTYEGQFLNLPKSGRIFVTNVTSTTALEGVIIQELESTSAVANPLWELEEGYEDVISATKGWPRSIAFFRSRLWLGGLSSRPQTILASKIGSFEDLDIGSGLDDEGIDITIDDDRVNLIRDIFPGRGLQIFTSGGEFTIRSSTEAATTPSTVSSQLQKETLHGSGPLPSSAAGTSWPAPVSVDGATVFVETNGGVARQFVFNDVEQSFNANNISILSQSLLGSPTSMAIRRATSGQPSDFLYLVNAVGKVAVLNSLREQDLLAWTLFETGGTFEDVTVSGREVYFVVKRTIDGNVVRYFERLNPDHFMDASTLQDNGSPTTTWTGFDQLDGETAVLRGDDFILADQLVVSGGFTTDESVQVLEAGINYSAKIKSLPIEVAIQGQSFAGQHKSIAFVNVRLYESRNIIVQHGTLNHEPSFREFGGEVLDQPIENFTGWKKVFVGGFERDLQVTVTQTEPLEFNVLSLVYGVKV